MYIFAQGSIYWGGGGGGRQGGSSPPPPPNGLPVIVHKIIRFAFLSPIMPALITEGLKFSLFKLSQIIKRFSFRTSCRREHTPSHAPPYSYIVNNGSPPPPPPPKFQVLDRTLVPVYGLAQIYSYQNKYYRKCICPHHR